MPLTNLSKLERFVGEINADIDQIPFLQSYRNEALARLKSISFPTSRDEEYKFLNLKQLERFELADHINLNSINKADISSFILEEAKDSMLVFVDGELSEDLSNVSGLPEGLCFNSFSKAKGSQLDEIETHIGKSVHPKNDFFSELNSALLRDGVVVYLPKETKIEKPLHILHVVTEESNNQVITPRLLILGDAYSKATIIENFVSTSQNQYISIPLAEVNLEEGANLKHYRIQRESRSAYHINRLTTNVNAYADYQSYTIHFGAKLSRSDVRANLIGQQSNSVLDGLVLVDGDQVSDTHTVMHHQQPHCTSHQLHKVVVNDASHSVFNGKIWVDQIAQRTDSFQENRNIILTDDAKVNTKPQLEIFADDVKCSHGATIGQLNAEEIFYLKSRGLNDSIAKELLLYGYALEVIENLEIKSLVEQLSTYVSKYAHKLIEESEAIS